MRRRVEPRGESSVRIGYADEDGELRAERIDCYFEAHNYRGTIRVVVGDDGVELVEDGIEFAYW